MQQRDYDFLAQSIAEDYPAEHELVLQGFEHTRPVTLRANTLKTTAENVARELDATGIACRRVPWYEDAFVLTEAREPAVRALPLYEQGDIYLQSLSSMLPPLALDPRAGENILDMAAAPGGKTTQMAALSAGEALITACEKNPLRADRLRFNLERQGASRVSVMQTDARKLDDFFSFDKVLLDAPCSGSGTVTARNRERAGFSAELATRSVKAQRALLAKALKVVKPGGIVVYSTCSILKRENEDVVRSAVERSRGAVEIEPIEGAFLEHAPLLPVTLEGCVCVRPTELYEGFFMAKLKRVR